MVNCIKVLVNSCKQWCKIIYKLEISVKCQQKSVNFDNFGDFFALVKHFLFLPHLPILTAFTNFYHIY